MKNWTASIENIHWHLSADKKWPQWFCYLSALRPWRIKIPKDRLIDLKNFFVKYRVCVISVAVLVAVVKKRLLLLVFVCFTIEGVYLYFSKLQYRVLESLFRLTVWLEKAQGLTVFLNWDSSFFFWKWVRGLTMTICNKITEWPGTDCEVSKIIHLI